MLRVNAWVSMGRIPSIAKSSVQSSNSSPVINHWIFLSTECRLDNEIFSTGSGGGVARARIWGLNLGAPQVHPDLIDHCSLTAGGPTPNCDVVESCMNETVSRERVRDRSPD